MFKKGVVCMVVLVASGSSYADFTGYSWSGYDGKICYVNFDTLTQTRLEDSHIGGELKSLKVSPLDGNVYAASKMPASSNVNLYKVDTTSGATTTLAGTNADTLSYTPNGQLYGISHTNNMLLSLNTILGEETEICSIYPYSQFAIENDSEAIAFDASSDWLYRVNLSSGAAISLGHLPLPLEYNDPDYWRWGEFDYGPDGTLYAWCRYRDASYGESRLYTIDMNELNALETNIWFGYSANEGTFAITPNIVPEPATLSLILLGGIALAKRRKRQNNSTTLRNGITM